MATNCTREWRSSIGLLMLLKPASLVSHTPADGAERAPPNINLNQGTLIRRCHDLNLNIKETEMTPEELNRIA